MRKKCDCLSIADAEQCSRFATRVLVDRKYGTVEYMCRQHVEYYKRHELLPDRVQVIYMRGTD